MSTRRLGRSFCTLGALLSIVALGGCRSRPGGPVLPQPKSEQVNVGYGTQDRQNVAGAVASADSAKLMASTPRSVIDMITGRFAGVEVRKLSNGGVSIRIRGSRSFKTNQDALIVIDGTPMHDGSRFLLDLEPRQVTSIEVLKDAAATSVYGSRGSNGVILISLRTAR